MSDRQTFIGYSLGIRGDISSNEDLIYEGVFDGGKIDVKDNTFIQGKDSVIKAEIHARQVVIMGKFEGKIIAKDIIQITATAHVSADLHTKKIEIADGAFYKGGLYLEEPVAR